MPLETIKLTAQFKLKEFPNELINLFSIYKDIVNYLVSYAYNNKITSFYRLKKETYKQLREKYPKLPSHYLYTACQMATAIYKSYRKRLSRGKAKGKPIFRKDVIMLDDHLFKIDIDAGIIKLSTPIGRIKLEYFPSKYHEKFKDWKVGQGWLIKKDNDYYINIVFSKNVELPDKSSDVIGIDLNENNITLSLPNGEFIQIITHERELRTRYFIKRRKIQKNIKSDKKKEQLLEKYGKRERNRIKDLYHKVANKIVEIAEKVGAIALEDLNKIRDSIKKSKEINGRLHRWSFRILQNIIKYKAKLKGINVVFVNPAYTSQICHLCNRFGERKGDRFYCETHGVVDADYNASVNILQRYYDKEISLFTSYKKVKQILISRLEVS